MKSFRSALILGNKLSSGVISTDNYMNTNETEEKIMEVVVNLDMRRKNCFMFPMAKKRK